MKKANKFKAVLVAGMMTVALCSCSNEDKNVIDAEPTKSVTDSVAVVTESEQTNSIEPGISVENISPEVEITPETVITPEESSNYDTLTEITELISGVIGTDRTDAEEKIGEYFGVELKDTTGAFVSSEIKGLVFRVHTYPQILSKDDIRFNGMEIYTDQSDGHVCLVMLTCTNSDYTTEHIEDTPEFRDEVKKLNSDLNNVLKNSMGEPFKSGRLAMDENSIYYYYKVSDNLLASVELRDFTDPDENGLLSTSVFYVDNEIFLIR